MSKKYTSTNPSRFINFSRASEATFVDSDGLIKTAKANEARLDHDLATGEPLGLLVEESRTNLFPTSETSIVPQNGTVETTFNPKFNINQHIYRADDTSGGLNRIFQGIGEPILANVPYTITVIFKNLSDTPDIGNKFEIILSATNIDLGGVKFNLTDDTFTSFNPPSNAGEILDVYMEDLGEGYYKLGYSAKAFDDGGSLQLFLRYFDETPDSRYSFSVSKIQIEQGSFPTSYIPTNGSQVTRVADSANIDGEMFSRIYNADEFTLFAEVHTPFIDKRVNNDFIFGVAEDINNRYHFFNEYNFFNKGSLISPSESLLPVKAALLYKGDGVVSNSINGIVSPDLTTTLNTENFKFIDVGTFLLNRGERVNLAYFKSVKFFPRALSDSELIELTTPET